MALDEEACRLIHWLPSAPWQQPSPARAQPTRPTGGLLMDLGTTKMIARKEGGIGWMIFNQPEKHNAVSYEMWLAVPKIMADFEADPAVRVIVVTGAGEKAFVSGADISEFEKKRGSADAIKVYDDAGNAAHAAMNGAHKPMVA